MAKMKFTYEEYNAYIKNTELDTKEHEQYLKSRKLTSIEENQYEMGKTKPGPVKIPVKKIACSYLTRSYGGVSLYELLTNNTHQGRGESLHKFFNILQKDGVQKCKDWLKSEECASSDSSEQNGQVGELPCAKYYPDLDLYLINTGKNRAFSAMLIGAEEMCFNSIIEQVKK